MVEDSGQHLQGHLAQLRLLALGEGLVEASGHGFGQQLQGHLARLQHLH